MFSFGPMHKQSSFSANEAARTLSAAPAKSPQSERGAAAMSLADLPLRTDAWVQALQTDVNLDQHALLLRLVEIGFLPGQPVRVVARAAGGGDPIAVRVGRSTFALRRGEAALVSVSRLSPTNEGAL